MFLSSNRNFKGFTSTYITIVPRFVSIHPRTENFPRRRDRRSRGRNNRNRRKDWLPRRPYKGHRSTLTIRRIQGFLGRLIDRIIPILFGRRDTRFVSFFRRGKLMFSHSYFNRVLPRMLNRVTRTRRGTGIRSSHRDRYRPIQRTGATLRGDHRQVASSYRGTKWGSKRRRQFSHLRPNHSSGSTNRRRRGFRTLFSKFFLGDRKEVSVGKINDSDLFFTKLRSWEPSFS